MEKSIFAHKGWFSPTGDWDNPSRGGNHGRPGTSPTNKTPHQNDDNDEDDAAATTAAADYDHGQDVDGEEENSDFGCKDKLTDNRSAILILDCLVNYQSYLDVFLEKFEESLWETDPGIAQLSDSLPEKGKLPSHIILLFLIIFYHHHYFP